MPEYTLVFARSARKELENLPATLAHRILSAIEQLRTSPRPPGARKLRGPEGLWRLRVGDYRVVYAIHDSERFVDIQVVRHRKDAYR